MSTKAREAFWEVALGNNTKMSSLAKLAIKEAEDEAQQRTWVGLTDDDLSDISDVATKSGNLYDLRLIIEAKLKEKNT